jgi:hypothetical protein
MRGDGGLAAVNTVDTTIGVEATVLTKEVTSPDFIGPKIKDAHPRSAQELGGAESSGGPDDAREPGL